MPIPCHHIIFDPNTHLHLDITLNHEGWPLIVESPSPFVDQILGDKLRAQNLEQLRHVALSLEGEIIHHSPADTPQTFGDTMRLGENFGWAIGVQIGAFNPYQSFTPSHGRLTRFDVPAPSQGLKVLPHITEGDEVQTGRSCLVDITATGEDRGQALSRLRYALDALVIEGVKTTLPLQAALLATDEFERVDYADNFLSVEYPGSFDILDLGIGHSRHIAAICAILKARTEKLSGKTRWAVMVNSDEFTIELSDTDTHIIAAIDEDSDKATIEIDVTTDWLPGQRVARLWIDNRLMVVQAKPTSEGFEVRYRGGLLQVSLSLLQA